MRDQKSFSNNKNFYTCRLFSPITSFLLLAVFNCTIKTCNHNSKISSFLPKFRFLSPLPDLKSTPISPKFCTLYFLVGVSFFITAHLDFKKNYKKLSTLYSAHAAVEDPEFENTDLHLILGTVIYHLFS